MRPRRDHAPDPAEQPPVDELSGLLSASARGDQAAFARLYDQTGARVFGMVLRVVRDQAQAEEVAQEVFLDVWRLSARFDPGRGSAICWMLTITHRRAVDRVRSAEAQTRRDAIYEQRAQAVPYDTTAEGAHRQLDAGRVRKALQALTPVQRQALDLAYFGGYTHREVAALLDLPEGTAKTRIRDGLIRLRDTMGVEQ